MINVARDNALYLQLPAARCDFYCLMARILTGKWRGLAGLVDLVGCDDLDVGPDVVLLVRGDAGLGRRGVGRRRPDGGGAMSNSAPAFARTNWVPPP